jgi:peptidoglycan/LPS O-acetylase OafA/YrhL
MASHRFSRPVPHALPFVLTVVALAAIVAAHVFPDDAIAMAYGLTAIAVVASLGLILAPAVDRFDRPRNHL